MKPLTRRHDLEAKLKIWAKEDGISTRDLPHVIQDLNHKDWDGLHVAGRGKIHSKIRLDKHLHKDEEECVLRHEYRHHWQHKTRTYHELRYVSSERKSFDSTVESVLNLIVEADASSYQFIHCGMTPAEKIFLKHLKQTIIWVRLGFGIEDEFDYNTECVRLWEERIPFIDLRISDQLFLT